MTIYDRPFATDDRTGAAALDRILPSLRMLAPQGFVLIDGLGYRGHEFMHSEFPQAWQWEYESRNYMFFDPVLLWALRHEEDSRWSAIQAVDPMKVLLAAKKYGLQYGAVFSRGGILTSRKKTILSMSREDREFTDEEMVLVSAMVDRLILDASTDPDLTSQEIETLRRYRDGLTHKDIAIELKVSVSTVKLRLGTITRKLNANSSVHAVAIAVQRRLI